MSVPTHLTWGSVTIAVAFVVHNWPRIKASLFRAWPWIRENGGVFGVIRTFFIGPKISPVHGERVIIPDSKPSPIAGETPKNI
jgi:hypothetical protein